MGDHLKNCKGNAKYLSSTIQNQIINIAASLVWSEILNKVKAVKYYSIGVDDTQNISTIEQESFVVRFVDLDTCEIQERFLGFNGLETTNAESIAKSIQEFLGDCGLPLEDCRGHNFFSNSAKRTAVLEKYAKVDHCAQLRLKKFSDTTWSPRADALVSLKLFDCVAQALNEIAEEERDRSVVSKAMCLVRNIQSFEFQLSLNIGTDLLQFTKGFCDWLQSPSLDLLEIRDVSQSVLRSLKEKRSEDRFSSLYQQTCDECNEPPQLPRRKGTLSGDNQPETYYRQELYYPFIDSVVSNFELRFESANSELIKVFALFHPKHFQSFQANFPNDSLKCLSGYYGSQEDPSPDIASLDVLKAEYKSFLNWIIKKDCNPEEGLRGVLNLLKTSGLQEVFPNIFILVTMGMTLPTHQCPTSVHLVF